MLRSEVGPAEFSDDRQYRYTLERRWNTELPSVLFIGLNPSTADEHKLDPTLRRCLRFADDWGYGRFYMANLFAYRATDPIDMKSSFAPIGEQDQHDNEVNDLYILKLANVCSLIVAAWGVHGNWLGRDTEVCLMLRKRGYDIKCLGTTKDGYPRHPLYVKADTQPIPYGGPPC